MEFNIKQIPNVISSVRIPLSIILIFLIHYPILFISGYFLCGISDVADGYLARRYKWETRLGEQLDSLGDAVFYSVILFLLIACTDIIKTQWVVCIAVIAVFRAINFAVAGIKFKKWGAMHTWGNKAAGVLLYLYAPVALIGNTISLVPALVICFIAVVSSVEETIVLLTSEQYDANQKSLFRK